MSGKTVTTHFCPECGTTVYWYSGIFPDEIGVSGGAFAEPSLPAPKVSIWEEHAQPWAIVGSTPTHQQQQRQPRAPARPQLPIEGS